MLCVLNYFKMVSYHNQIADQHSRHEVFGQGRRAWSTPWNYHLVYSFISMHDLITIPYTEYALVGGPKIWGTQGPAPLGWNVSDPLETRPSTTFYHAIFGRCRSNGTCVITDIMRTIWPFTVIETDTDRPATYDFLLVIRSNHGPISCRFRDKGRFRSKIANFPTSVCLPPLGGVTLEFCKFCNGGRTIKISWFFTQLFKKNNYNADFLRHRIRKQQAEVWGSNM